ncbi:MAG: efflux RND transporter permease subunit [Plectolyngbya sp. WJT66-NPBG17]|nr:efflux RND transporter permease subunit [Plectolyngbya sp. WJT66-NPBG17]
MTTQPSPSRGFSISSIAIRRHIATLMLTLTAIVIGVYFLFGLQVDLLPSITYPRIGVRVNSPGISPDVAVDEVTRPLEEALSATEGVVQVYSQTREGQVSVDLFFQPGGNIDQALNDATAAFNRARGNLPDTIEEPTLFKVDPSQLPVYEFAVTSPSSKLVDLRVFADEELSRELGVVEGVAAVDVAGGVEEEVRVLVDLDRLQALGVGLNSVLQELEETNQDVSGGRILGKNSEPLTRTIGRFKDAAEIQNLSFPVVGEPTTTATESTTQTTAPVPAERVYLRDFAQVNDGTQKQRVFVNLNGQPAVKVSVQKQPDANTIQVVEGVKRRIEELRRSNIIPAEMQLLPTLDESKFIQASLNSVTEAALSGAALAGLSVLLFLGSLRQTFIITLTIPLCTLVAITAMKLSGFSLNIFSLAGLAISIGQAVDTSVVILENIDKRATVQGGAAGLASQGTGAAIDLVEDSSREVESSLVSATSANLVSVVPFVLIGGFISLLFNELILTICFAVVASLLVAVTVVPMLASRLLAIRWSSRINRFWLFRQFDQRLAGGTRRYAGLLAKITRRPIIAIALTVLVLGGGGLWMTGRIPQEILPRISTGQANLFAQFPPGTPLETSQRVMQEVDKILQAQPETDYVFSTVGGSLFGNATSENPLRASSNITLKPNTDVEEFVEKVNGEFRRLNLVETTLRLSPGQVRGLILNNSPVRGAEIDVILQGQNLEQLEAAGRQVLGALSQSTLARFRPDADQRQPEIQIERDRERAAELGLNTLAVGETIQTAIEGSIPTQIQRGNRLVDVRVELNEDAIQSASQVERIPLFTDDNQIVRLGDVATIRTGQAPGQIQRINQRQVFQIAGTLNQGASLGNALSEVDRLFQTIQLPEGVSRLPSSAAESNQQLQDALPLLGGLAAFLVFVVMAVQYNSLIDPLVIMFTIPLALSGGIIGLFVTQTAIGATVIVGAVLLVGIVVNNAIIMVETANEIYKNEGLDRRSAMLRAAPERLRPILMTTVTTVLGVFPLALGLGEGSEFLQPLGVVVFSGLSLATLLTLFIIPCFYVLLHRWTDGRKERKSRSTRSLPKVEEPISSISKASQDGVS